MLRLIRLRLRDFRNYPALNWEPAAQALVVTGPNGTGKTNLLEAISVLAPGRGLRGARASELARRDNGIPAPEWGVSARFASSSGPLEIGTGAVGANRRAFLLNGEPPRNQAEIAARLGAVWLTPQMDGLFQESASGRRRFLDRLVYALEPAHAREIAAHDSAQSQRARLLATGRADPAWLAGLEDSIARHAVAATAARAGLVRDLNRILAQGAAAGFPQARMLLLCPIAERLEAGSALIAEDWLRDMQAASRPADAQAGSARYGAQRADMMLMDEQSGRTADLASTGQQKALLIGVILGHAALIGRMRGEAPLLLLDEPMVHLDAERRALLCAAIRALPTQVVLTGTDAESFAGLQGAAAFYLARDGQLETDPGA